MDKTVYNILKKKCKACNQKNTCLVCTSGAKNEYYRVAEYCHNLMYNFNEKYTFMALTEHQLTEGLQELNCKPEDVVKLNNSYFIIKSKKEEYEILMSFIEFIKKASYYHDQYLYDAFYYAMEDLEYCINEDDLELLKYLDIDTSEYLNNDRFKIIMESAKKDYLENCIFK